MTRPVIAARITLEDTFVNRIQLSGQTIQKFGPVHLQLSLHPLLRTAIIFDPDKTVALLPIFQPLPVHLPRQPLPPVQAYLDMERKPGLDPRIHPSHLRVDLIVIQDVTRPVPPDDVLAPVLKRGADRKSTRLNSSHVS